MQPLGRQPLNQENIPISSSSHERIFSREMCFDELNCCSCCASLHLTIFSRVVEKNGRGVLRTFLKNPIYSSKVICQKNLQSVNSQLESTVVSFTNLVKLIRSILKYLFGLQFFELPSVEFGFYFQDPKWT